MRIAIVGAGGYTFPLRLIRDVLAFESTQDATFALTDIDPAGLERTRRLAERLIDGHGLRAWVEADVDRRAMLRDADVVLVTFQVGGLDAYRHRRGDPASLRRRPDRRRHARPRRRLPRPAHGDRAGGDRRRHARALPRRAADPVREPDGDQLLADRGLGLRTVGLCHSVQRTSRMLARIIGIEDRQWTFRRAGINHQAWFARVPRATAWT